MREQRGVLIVSGEDGANLAPRKVLNEAGFLVRIAQACTQARLGLMSIGVASVPFADTALPDRTWAGVPALASEDGWHVPVVIVPPVVDMNLYSCINTLENGDFDFFVPPFYLQDISYVLKSAAQKNVAIQALGTA